MIDSHFAILGALIAVAGNVAYARDTLRGRTRPNRVSWGLWALAPMIAFAAELVAHAGLGSVLTFAVGFGPLLVLIASFADAHAYAAVTRLDIACGLLSLLALVGWGLTGTGGVAICLSIVADFLAAIPTLHQAYVRPDSESANAFVAGSLGSVITLAAIPPGRWSFATAAFPAYIVVASSAIAVLVLLPAARWPEPRRHLTRPEEAEG